VAEAILDEIGAVPRQRILLPRADIARPALAEGLRRAGAHVDEIASYRTGLARPQEADEIRQMLAAGEIDVLTFTSSSTVRNLVATLDPLPTLPEQTVVACIGPITAETARELGLRVHVTASEHTVEGLLTAMSDYLRAAPNGADEKMK
jgi:uroporphyrinogen III methyltransferase/synthase